MVTNKKVFLVDDCSFSVKLCVRCLSKNGFSNIHIFNSGKELLNNLDGKPDIIFLDYQLNDYTGKELLQKIKAFNPFILVVMISSQSSTDINTDLLNSGAFDYIIKDDNFIDKITELSHKLVSIFSFLQNTPDPEVLKISEKEYVNSSLNALKINSTKNLK